MTHLKIQIKNTILIQREMRIKIFKTTNKHLKVEDQWKGEEVDRIEESQILKPAIKKRA